MLLQVTALPSHSVTFCGRAGGGGCANTANSSYVPFFSWYKEVDTDRLILLCFVIMSCLAVLGDMGKLYWKYVK